METYGGGVQADYWTGGGIDEIDAVAFVENFAKILTSRKAHENVMKVSKTKGPWHSGV